MGKAIAEYHLIVAIEMSQKIGSNSMKLLFYVILDPDRFSQLINTLT